MPATRRLVLDLPEDIAAALESRVAEGGFADISEAVSSAVLAVELAAGDGPPRGIGEAVWRDFAARCRDTAARIDAGLERTWSAEEVRIELARRRRADEG